MAVKKGILDNFLKPSSHYTDNQKNLRSIFIDKTEDDLKPDPQNFLEASILEESNGTQLEHNKDTIGTQNILSHLPSSLKFQDSIGTHQEHNKNTNETQNGHNKNTSGTQQEHKKLNRNTTRAQLEHGKEHKIEHNKNTIGTHIEHNKTTTSGLSYLTGIQKQLIVFFYQSCKKTRSHITEEFSLINIANVLNIRHGSVKTSLRRLEEKGFINSLQFKKGRGGWTKFELPDNTYRELLENEKEHNWNTIGTQLEHISDTYRNTEKDTTNSSSSSIDIITTTTKIGEEWNFDITHYQRFGFTISQLKQLTALSVISAAEVEQSLIEFSYDLDNNTLPSIKTSKINFLMGLLRSGHSYVSEGFKKEQDAMITEMAKRAEAKQKKFLEAKFLAWEECLSDEDRRQILAKMPTSLIVLEKTYGLGHQAIKKWYFDYFMQNLLE